MYLISRDAELGNNTLSKILQDFNTKELPKLAKWKNYYDGKQAILLKTYSDTSKPISRIVVNYCREIVNQYAGYLTGVPIKYRNDDFEDVIDVLNYNDIKEEDMQYLKNALIYGKAFEVNYVDEEGKQRFRLFDSRECIPVYADDLNNELLYVIRFYQEDLVETDDIKYIVEVYGPKTIKTYRSAPGFASFTLLNERPHFFEQCPVTVFELNNENESIFNPIMSLQDAYNDLISSQLDDYNAFVDAYLVIKGAQISDDDASAMRENRIMMVDETADVSFLTKNISNDNIKIMLDCYKEEIYKKTNCPDYSDDTFNATSGIAIRYKLIALENSVSNIQNKFTKALQRRIELISEILNLTSTEQVWRDVKIEFTRNLPDTLTPSSIDDLIKLQGIVSNETLLGMLPFINDVDAEMEKVRLQKESNMSLYSFNTTTEVDDDEQLLEQSGD